MEDLSNGSVTELPQLAHTGLPKEISGEPAKSVTARQLGLTHGHTYRINASATNGVGMVGAPCPTTMLIIDETPPEGPELGVDPVSMHVVVEPCPKYAT